MAEIFGLFPKYNIQQNALIKAPSSDAPAVSDSADDRINIKGSKKKKIIFGSAAASSIISAGLAGLFLAKGFHGSSIQKIFKKAGYDTAYYAGKAESGLSKALQAVSNITSIKDTLFDKILRADRITASFASGTRNLFKNIVTRTLISRYNKIGAQIFNMSSMLKQYTAPEIMKLDNYSLNTPAAVKGTEKTLREWAQILSEQSSAMLETFENGFSSGAVKERSIERNRLLEGAAERVYKKFFKDWGLIKPENYRAYAAQEVTKDAHAVLNCEIQNIRKKITNNIPDIYNELKAQISSLMYSLNPKDAQNAQRLADVKQLLEKFKSCSGLSESAQRLEVSCSAADILKSLSSEISQNSSYSALKKQELINKAEDIIKLLAESDEKSKGALENIMTILKGLNSVHSKGRKIVSDSELRLFIKTAEKISSAIRQTADKEAGEFFLKNAEIEIGSAATDVMAVLFPAGIAAYSIGKSRGKDEKISSALDTGIPLAGTFAVFIYGTAKMFSGAKNLILAGASGLSLNLLGKYIDKLYKEYKKSGSFAKTAADEYKRIISNLSGSKETKKAAQKQNTNQNL